MTTMNIKHYAGPLLLSAALLGTPMALAAHGTTERAHKAIDQCRDAAAEQYNIDRRKARFWQISQAGRYVRVWMKVRTEQRADRVKTLCLVHKTDQQQPVALRALN